jgi:hypothetical protein
MNKFTDAARLMAERSAKGPANESDRARATYEQISQHLSTNPAPVQVDHEGNVVRLYKPDTDRLFQIICLADGTFHLKENSTGPQRVVTYSMPRTYTTHTPVPEEKMIEQVVTWLAT